LFSKETAVLLEMGAESYGLENKPPYHTNTVYKRYLRYKQHKQYGAMQALVRQFRKTSPHMALHEFFHVREIQLFYDLAMDTLLALP
jgi:hypothetical protein